MYKVSFVCLSVRYSSSFLSFQAERNVLVSRLDTSGSSVAKIWDWGVLTLAFPIATYTYTVTRLNETKQQCH